MEKSLKHTQEVFKGALEAAVKERLRGKTPGGAGRRSQGGEHRERPDRAEH